MVYYQQNIEGIQKADEGSNVNSESATQNSVSNSQASTDGIQTAPKVIVPAINRPKPAPKMLVLFTRQDSIKLNLNAEKQEPGDYLFKNKLVELTGDIQALKSISYHTTNVSKDTITSTHDSIPSLSKEIKLNSTTESPKPLPVSKKSNDFGEHTDWMVGIIILAIFTAGYIKISANKYLNDLFSGVRYQQAVSKLYTTINIQNSKPSTALTGLFFINTSLLIFEFVVIHENAGGFYLYLFILLGLIGFFFLKNTIYRFIGFIFDTQQKSGEYLYNANLLSKVYGISILPLVSVIPFVDTKTGSFLLKIGILMFIFMYLIQLFRGAKIILSSLLSIFYMFLYFCALEILPLTLLYKLIIH